MAVIGEHKKELGASAVCVILVAADTGCLFHRVPEHVIFIA